MSLRCGFELELRETLWRQRNINGRAASKLQRHDATGLLKHCCACENARAENLPTRLGSLVLMELNVLRREKEFRYQNLNLIGLAICRCVEIITSERKSMVEFRPTLAVYFLLFLSPIIEAIESGAGFELVQRRTEDQYSMHSDRLLMLG